MSTKAIIILLLIAGAAIFLLFHFGMKKMVYSKVDFPFEQDGTKILKGTRLGQLEKIDGKLVLIKNNKLSLIPGGFVAGVIDQDVIVKKEFLL